MNALVVLFDYSYNSSNYARNAWAKGFHLGVIGVSDSMVPGNPLSVPDVSVVKNLGGGLTAVIAPNSTKRNLACS